MKRFKIFILLICVFVPFSFVGCENKNKETLSTPSIVEIRSGTVVFNPVKNADYYTVSINDFTVSVDVKNNNKVEIVDNQINFDASNIFVIGNSYSIKIKANSHSRNSSKFSQSYSYKHNGNISKPKNLKINGNILTWDMVENASYYLVKVVTPNDEILTDKNGNVLEGTDFESIASADLTEYCFNTNQFDFTSVLNTAGNYNFYVSAVSSNGTNYVESGYSTTSPYSHYVTLSTPVNSVIKKIDSALHMFTKIDSNANAILIDCNGVEKTIEINTASTCITSVNDNYFDINLTQFFQGETFNQVDLNSLNHYAFRTKSAFVTGNIENEFYKNSNFSDYVYFDNTHVLQKPTLEIERDLVNDCFLVSWTCPDKAYVSEYTLLVLTSSGIKKFYLESNVESKLIYDDFISIAIQANGVGNYESSALSDFVSNPTFANQPSSLNCSLSDSRLSWNAIGDAYYIVEFAGEYFATDLPYYTIDTNKILTNNYSIKVTAIQNNFKHTTKVLNYVFEKTLDTPTFEYGQGFGSSNLYELTFTGVDNAIGYYIYLKTKDASDYEQIDQLYTSTKIDLSKYICSEGVYTDYEVKVQAVADKNGIYKNSALSRAVSVSHIQVLEKPQFYKIYDTVLPVTKQVSGNTFKYILRFYGVNSAGNYEVLINYNKITVPAKNNFYTGLYEVDISNYLIAANNYEIKIRAIPSNQAINIQSSEYNVANYVLTKQLPMVENIKLTENEGIYTLSFNPVNNASSYRLRIVKENDSNYPNYLNSLGLSNSFEITQALDVTNYLKQQGIYYFYLTALAPKQNSYYADSIESSDYGYINKLATLNSPTKVNHINLTKDSYLLEWIGDDFADYYLVKITNPQNIVNEFKVYNATSTDINQYITVQGTYSFAIYSMITPSSENSKLYTSSPATNVEFNYTYQTQKDYERYAVNMYGSSYNFYVEDVNALKHLLWYHYLYEIENSSNLNIMLKGKLKAGNTQESVREIILRFAEEANNSLTYNFNNDEQWLNLIGQQTSTDNTLFTYLCTKLLEVYPEYGILQNFNLEHSNGNYKFKLNYKNTLNQEKTSSAVQTFTNDNYGDEYNYIDIYSRKSPTGAFAIDSREEALVTTTEQLIHAVQHNKKPKFIGESETAETVYNNAKLVLSAIVTNSMTDSEKVNAIFNWLSASFDLTYYSISEKAYLSGSLEQDNLANYGLNKIYYLEGIFEDISALDNGNIVVGSNLATSKSYSKAFALLCAIEGINSVVVNGTYSYYDTTSKKDVTIDHAWNKVYVDTSVDNSGKSWYALDLTFSDNRIFFNDLRKGYGISSHTYYLTTDNFAETKLNVKDMNHLISSAYKTEKTCSSNYNYYKNSSFALTHNQISNTILDFEDATTTVSSFEYANEFSSKLEYQKYAKTTGYGKLQSFLLNSMIYAKYKADNNASRKSVFEFKFNWSDNGGINTFDIEKLKEIFGTAPNNYSLRLKLVLDANNSVYTVEDSENSTTTVVYIVEKTA